jgi:HAD superfamily hydrolase (TIGR01509 family)
MNTGTPSPIQALIFDMDGLLVDSEPLTGIALDALLRQYGCAIDSDDAELNERLMGRRMPEILAALAEICGIMAPPEELNETLEALRVETIRGRLQAHRGAEELLDFARAAGLRLALATSGRRSYVDAVLAESRFTGRFYVEVTGESVTHGKPDPETYLLAASRLGVAPAGCVVLEDAPNGIAAAVAAGMRAVAVPNAHSRELHFSTAPEVVLSDLHAVLPWLQDQGIGSSLQSAWSMITSITSEHLNAIIAFVCDVEGAVRSDREEGRIHELAGGASPLAHDPE